MNLLGYIMIHYSVYTLTLYRYILPVFIVPGCNSAFRQEGAVEAHSRTGGCGIPGVIHAGLFYIIHSIVYTSVYVE